MFSRMFSTAVLAKSLLSTTRSRLPVIGRSVEHDTRISLPYVRKLMPQLKRPIRYDRSVEHRTMISRRLNAFRRITEDPIRHQYAGYTPAVISGPDEIGQTEKTAIDGHPKYCNFFTWKTAKPYSVEHKTLISGRLDAFRRIIGYPICLQLAVSPNLDEIGQIEETTLNDGYKPTLELDMLMASPILDGLVSIVTRTAKLYWDGLSPEARRRCKARIADCWRVARFAAAVLFGLLAAFLWSNTELDPVTGRRRLFLYDDLMLERRGHRDVNVLIEHYRSLGMLLDPSHPAYQRVAALATRVLDANDDVAAVRDRHWYVVVVNDRQVGAFVSTVGCIFVTTGMADDANDDQLSVIIGHEVSHCTQRHTNQTMSARLAFDVARLAATAVIWATLSFAWALSAQLFVPAFQHLFLELPLSRAIETEADRDGLMMAARACVDVAEGGRYWRQTDERTDGQSDRTWWKSTHPSHSDRARRLSALVTEALELQKSAGCDGPPANSAASR